MIPQDSQKVASRAESIYEQRLRAMLERSHPDEFVAIEPVSGDYFLGRTLSEAVGAARRTHPEHLVHAMRVGHETTVHIGVCLR